MRKIIFVGIAIVILIPVLGVGYWLISPLFRDEEVNEEFPYARVAIVPTEMSNTEANATMETAAGQTESVAEQMPEVTATEIGRGNFTEIDAVHKGSGDAILYQLSDGTSVLRFENFEVTNGPDLHVFLVTSANPTRADLHNGTELDLGELKGNLGNQNYEIPSGTDLSQYQSVVIYCVPFQVVFSTARLN